MAKSFNENTLTEQPVIDWLKEMGYDYEIKKIKYLSLRGLLLLRLMSGEVGI